MGLCGGLLARRGGGPGCIYCAAESGEAFGVMVHGLAEVAVMVGTRFVALEDGCIGPAEVMIRERD